MARNQQKLFDNLKEIIEAVVIGDTAKALQIDKETFNDESKMAAAGHTGASLPDQRIQLLGHIFQGATKGSVSITSSENDQPAQITYSTASGEQTLLFHHTIHEGEKRTIFTAVRLG